MRYFSCRVLFGALFFLISSTMYSYNDLNESCSMVAVPDNYSHDEKDQSGFSVGSFSHASYSQIFSSDASIVITYYDALFFLVQNNEFCWKRYKLSSDEIHRLFKVAYTGIVSKLLSFDHLTDQGIAELWSLYKRHCWKQEKVEKCEESLKRKLQQRAERLEEQRLQQEKQRTLKEQKEAEIQKQNTEQEQRVKRLEKVYKEEILEFSDYDSPYQNERQLALQQTREDSYQQHEQSYELDEQTTCLLMAQGIDHNQFRNLSGTIFQHQLFKEVEQCYKKAAKIVYEHGLKQSVFVPSILEFAQSAFQAVGVEQFSLALQLNDLSDFMIETSLSVCKGIIGSACNAVDMYVLHPQETIKHFASLLGGVMKFVGDAMMYADSQDVGWSYYAQCLEKEHQYDVQYAQEVVDQCKLWCEQSSVQEKIQATSTVITDCILHPKLFSMAGKACCGLITKIPEIKFLEGFADISAEYGLATEFGEVGLNSLENVGMSLMESEAKAINFKTAQSITKVKSVKSLEDKIVYQAEKYKNWKPKEVDTRSLLDKNLEIAVDAKKDAVRIKKLLDGRVRYYEAEKAARTPGPTRGSNYVVEYDPGRGIVRGWYESYDHAGNVNRVHPKMINGKKIESIHYPHTGEESTTIAAKLKGK